MCTGMYIREEEIFHAIYKQAEKEIDWNEMIDYIEKILIYQDKKVIIKWSKIF